LTIGRIAAAHEWFNDIRQLAPVCTPTYYMLPWGHPSQNLKRHRDRFGRATVSIDMRSDSYLRFRQTVSGPSVFQYTQINLINSTYSGICLQACIRPSPCTSQIFWG